MNPTSKDRVTVVSTDTISKRQVVHILKAKMPCAREEDITPFADAACAGKECLTVGELLLNCFAETTAFTTEVNGRARDA